VKWQEGQPLLVGKGNGKDKKDGEVRKEEGRKIVLV